MSESQKAQDATWLYDPIAVAGVEVDKRGTFYTLKFVDFVGIAREIIVKREDIFLRWSEVLAELVKNGYRFNVIDGGERALRALLAHHRVPAQITLEALQNQSQQQEAVKANTKATRGAVRKASKKLPSMN